MFNNFIFLKAAGFAAYWAQPSGGIIHDFVTAAILAIIVVVVAVPEGLPMMIAMVLAINMKAAERQGAGAQAARHRDRC